MLRISITSDDERSKHTHDSRTYSSRTEEQDVVGYSLSRSLDMLILRGSQRGTCDQIQGVRVQALIMEDEELVHRGQRDNTCGIGYVEYLVKCCRGSFSYQWVHRELRTCAPGSPFSARYTPDAHATAMNL